MPEEKIPKLKVRNCGVALPVIDLRDWFAGQALMGLIVGRNGLDDEKAAEVSYQLADAMLLEREVK